MELFEKKCVPCKGSMPRLESENVSRYLKEINPEWYVVDDKKIRRKFKLKDFRENVTFVNGIAEMAEYEGHHPDLCILWNILEVTLWTHKIGGLSENDFILAAKIDEIYSALFAEHYVSHME